MIDHDPSILPAFDRRHRRLLLGLVVAFALALLLRLNGWSLPAWHAFIDGSPATEVLLGQARSIRSDDFVLDLPMNLAQESHRPRFPVVNQNIGSGQYMPAPIEVPAGAFITLFRPFVWGFLLGPDVGLAWKWWGLVLGLFYSLFLVFMLVSGNRFGLSAWASLATVASPYFQFWSFHKAEIAIHWATVFVAAACLLAARRRWVIWAAGAVLGWSLAAMALDHIYPPLAVTLGWLLPFAGAAWCWDRRRFLRLRADGRTRIAAGIFAAAFAALSLGAFFTQAAGPLAVLHDTVYPGRRFSTGGDLPLWAFFSHDFFAQAWEKGNPWMGNICEGASFIFVFPAIWMLLLVLLIRGRRIFEPWGIFLAVYIAALAAYAYWGFPHWLAQVTLFGMATSDRVQLGMGLANQLMLVGACSHAGLRRELTPATRWIGLGLWLALLAACGWSFAAHWPALGREGFWLGLAFQASLGYVLWVWDRPVLGVASLAIASLAYTLGFNPWVRGGADYVLHNPLSAGITRLEQAQPEARWVVYGDVVLANLPRILGIKSIGGYNGYPDLADWKIFDPADSYRQIYNQAGFVIFKAADPIPATFESPQPGLVQVKANPLDPAFGRSGVRYFLVVDPPEQEQFERLGSFRVVLNYGGKVVYERK